MKRAAIYTRFSTDKQSDASTEDQRRLCERVAGARIVAVHSDDAVSGSTPFTQRPGGRAVLADVLAKRVDLLLVESLDRISRDQVDLERTVRRIEHNGVRIVGVSDGYDSAAASRKVVRAVRGIVAEMYLDDLRAKTHRGLVGKVERGFIASGKSYGYRIERTDEGSRYAVDAAQAAVVRDIFAAYAAGKGLRAIVHELNARGVPSPRGSTWAVSALYGSPAKGSGVLNNSLYVGRLVWNRSQWVKDPDTGKRQRIDRPRSEWLESVDESLRIVDDATWAKVRARIDPGTGQRPGRPGVTLFGGLLRCPHCSGPLIAIDRRSYGCSARKDRGASVCPGFTLPRKRVDEALLAFVRLMIESPGTGAAFEREMREQMAEDDSGRETDADRLRVLDKQIDRLVEAVATMGVSESLAARLRAAETERAALRERIAAGPAPVDVRRLWREVQGNLRRVLDVDPQVARAAVAEALGPLLVTVSPSGETWGTVIVKGIAAQGGAAPLTVVAGAGFEPATFGL